MSDKNIQTEIEEELAVFMPEDKMKFERDFENDPEIKKLRALVQRQKQAFQIVQSIQTQKRIAEIKLRVIRRVKQDMSEKVEKVNLLKLQIPEEKLRLIVNNLIAIHMVCDILESYSNEIEWILQEHAPDYHIESFNNILTLGAQASKQIDWIEENTDLMQYDSWGNECDTFANMIRNKAAKLIRKSAELRAIGKSKEEDQ